MNDHRRSTIAEERMAVAPIFQVDVSVGEFHGGFAVLFHTEVQHVTGVMAFGTLQAVLLAVWIEVRPRGLEVGTIALGILMEVNSVFARSQVMHFYIERDALGSALRQGNRSHVLALGIFHLNHSFGCADERAENHGDQYRSN